MTIVRCAKCRVVVLDSNEDAEYQVQCPECGSRYNIKLDKGDVVSFIKLNQAVTSKGA